MCIITFRDFHWCIFSFFDAMGRGRNNRMASYRYFRFKQWRGMELWAEAERIYSYERNRASILWRL